MTNLQVWLAMVKRTVDVGHETRGKKLSWARKVLPTPRKLQEFLLASFYSAYKLSDSAQAFRVSKIIGFDALA